jgi:inner membrane transporter RhtA
LREILASLVAATSLCVLLRLFVSDRRSHANQKMSEQDTDAGLGGAATTVTQTRWVPPELMAIGSMFSVQLGAALAVPVMSGIGSVATTALRLFWAGILLAVIVRPRFRAMTRHQWLASVGLGIVIAVLTLCYFISISRIPMGPATAIEFLGPLGVALVGSRRFLHLTLAIVAAAGVLLLTREESHWSVDALGLCFAAGAGLGWAAYILLMKRVGASFPGLHGLSVALLVAAIAAMPIGFVAGGNMFKLTPVLWTIGLALLNPLLPYVLELTALRRMSTHTFGIFMSMEPGISAVLGFAILAQHLTVRQIAGIGCVVVASAVTSIRSRQ